MVRAARQDGGGDQGKRMRILMRLFAGTVLAWCLPSGSPLGDDATLATSPAIATNVQQFVPALFGSGPDSLRNQLTCPDPQVPGGQVLTTCKVRVDTEGRVRPTDAFCTGARGTPTRYRQHMERVLGASKFTPARVDGVPVPVQFAIVAWFRDEGGDCAASVVLNGGERDPETGLNYIGPQEIRNDGGWQGRLRLRKHWDRQRVWNRTGSMIRVSVAVSERGEASDPRIEQHESLFFDAAEVERALTVSRFIPGFHQGHPRAMRYFETVHFGGLRGSYFPED